MKKILVLLFLACVFFQAYSQSVDENILRTASEKFIKNNSHIFANYTYSISDSETLYYENTPIAYAQILSPKGFIIISASNSVYPILAFSADGNYSRDNNPGFKLFLEFYSKNIKWTINQQLNATNDVQWAWDRFLQGKPLQNISKDTRSVLPLLTTKWDQNNPYNLACPTDVNGSGGHVYAGCVATAMGQLLYYHRWPQIGTGSYSYLHPVYGTIQADFASSQYNFDEMTSSILSENQQITQLLFHLGVSVDMNYGPDGSGMWNHSAARSLKNYFKYCDQTRYVFRDSTSLNWDSLVITNLQNKKPLYYAGWGDTTFTMGHAFVCDGYETNDFYHFNWGWNGSYDGYFYTGQLNPGGSNFNLCQELIVDIYPDTLTYTYPNYCQGLTEINSPTGTITDGSGANNYQAGNDCSWWLNPSCGTIPKLTFDNFQLSVGDTLFIYDGSPTSHSFVDFYTFGKEPILSSQIPATTLISDSGMFYFEFKSLNQGDGFILSYNTTYCENKILADSQGHITDGSGICNYKKGTNCRWEIEFADTSSIFIHVNEFDLYSQSTTHYVSIYKDNLSSSNLLYKFTSQNLPPIDFNLTTKKLIIRFVSNYIGFAQGWNFDYLSIPNSIDDNSFTRHISVYPNPLTELSYLYVNYPFKNGNISIIDIAGKIITSKEIVNISESNQIDLKELFNSMSPGFYTLVFESEGKRNTVKVIVN